MEGGRRASLADGHLLPGILLFLAAGKFLSVSLSPLPALTEGLATFCAIQTSRSGTGIATGPRPHPS